MREDVRSNLEIHTNGLITDQGMQFAFTEIETNIPRVDFLHGVLSNFNNLLNL